MLDFLTSTFPRRIVVAIYCLSIAYACAWVPWSAGPYQGQHFRAGYGFVWAGPQIPPFKDVFDQVAWENESGIRYIHAATSHVDFPRVWLRIAALTGIFVAALVLLPRPRPGPASVAG